LGRSKKIGNLSLVRQKIANFSPQGTKNRNIFVVEKKITKNSSQALDLFTGEIELLKKTTCYFFIL
jgi:hypothetical protein